MWERDFLMLRYLAPRESVKYCEKHESCYLCVIECKLV